MARYTYAVKGKTAYSLDSARKKAVKAVEEKLGKGWTEQAVLVERYDHMDLIVIGAVRGYAGQFGNVYYWEEGSMRNGRYVAKLPRKPIDTDGKLIR